MVFFIFSRISFGRKSLLSDQKKSAKELFLRSNSACLPRQSTRVLCNHQTVSYVFAQHIKKKKLVFSICQSRTAYTKGHTLNVKGCSFTGFKTPRLATKYQLFNSISLLLLCFFITFFLSIDISTALRTNHNKRRTTTNER
jgi:hypothetical protein